MCILHPPPHTRPRETNMYVYVHVLLLSECVERVTERKIDTYRDRDRERIQERQREILTLLGKLHDIVKTLDVNPDGQGNVVLPHRGEQGREVDNPVDPKKAILLHF